MYFEILSPKLLRETGISLDFSSVLYGHFSPHKSHKEIKRNLINLYTCLLYFNLLRQDMFPIDESGSGQAVFTTYFMMLDNGNQTRTCDIKIVVL